MQAGQFQITDLIVCIVLVLVALSLSNAMIGCGDGNETATRPAEGADAGDPAAGNGKSGQATMPKLQDVIDEFAELTKENRSPAARSRARQMENSIRIKGIHSGCVLFAQGNADRYPGLKADGTYANPVTAAPTVYGSGGLDGSHPATRYAILMNNNYFTAEWAHSPIESGKTDAQFGKAVTHANFSYAMLQIEPGTTRTNEWLATTNSQAVAISDRNKGEDSSAAAAESIHGQPWKGGVAYNDNHVEFADSHILTTKYSGGAELEADNLFVAGDTTDGAPAGAKQYDAAMVFQDATTLVNQD